MNSWFNSTLIVCIHVLRLFFYCRPFLKSLLNLLQYCFCFMFRFFVCKAFGILASPPEIKPALLALEGQVLTSGLPEKSLSIYFTFCLEGQCFCTSTFFLFCLEFLHMQPEKELYLSRVSPVKLLFIGGLMGGVPAYPLEAL